MMTLTSDVGSLPVEHEAPCSNLLELPAPALKAASVDLHGPAWTGVGHHQTLTKSTEQRKRNARAAVGEVRS